MYCRKYLFIIVMNLSIFSCWMYYCNWAFMWILRAPVAIAIFLNCLIFCNIVRELYVKLNSDSQFSDKNRYRCMSVTFGSISSAFFSKLAKSTLILIVVLGVHYIFLDILLAVLSGFNFHTINRPSIIVHGISIIVNSMLVGVASLLNNVQ